MDFSAITSLSLKEAYRGTLFDEVIEDSDYLDKLFEHRNRTQIFVLDSVDAGHSVFIDNTSGVGRNKCFYVGNPKNIDVFLWHIDGVLYKRDTKCDCALLTTKACFFVEFKVNAQNNSNEAIRENYEKATMQLSSTIKDVTNRCQATGRNIHSERDLQAFVVLNKTVPRILSYQKSLRVKFLRENKVRLSFENEAIID